MKNDPQYLKKKRVNGSLALGAGALLFALGVFLMNSVIGFTNRHQLMYSPHLLRDLGYPVLKLWDMARLLSVVMQLAFLKYTAMQRITLILCRYRIWHAQLMMSFLTNIFKKNYSVKVINNSKNTHGSEWPSKHLRYTKKLLRAHLSDNKSAVAAFTL